MQILHHKGERSETTDLLRPDYGVFVQISVLSDVFLYLFYTFLYKTC